MIRITEKSRFYDPAKVNQAFNVGFDRAGRMFTQRLTRGLTTGSRSGRVYIIRGRSYRASAPGEMPAKRTGRLAGSVDYHIGKLMLTFGDQADYGGYLEDGTDRMDARPHVQTIGERHGADGLNLVMQQLQKAF